MRTTNANHLPRSGRRRAPADRIALATIVAAGLAMHGAAYDLSWHTIDAGGGASGSGPWLLVGTIGQPDAGAMQGGGVDGFSLAGGFWSAGSSSAGRTCAGDIDGSGSVDGADIGLLLAGWGAGGAGDLDGSGVVDGADLGLLLSAWGPCDE